MGYELSVENKITLPKVWKNIWYKLGEKRNTIATVKNVKNENRNTDCFMLERPFTGTNVWKRMFIWQTDEYFVVNFERKRKGFRKKVRGLSREHVEPSKINFEKIHWTILIMSWQ